LEKNDEKNKNDDFVFVVLGALVYALLSLMISYNVAYAVYVAIGFLSTGLVALMLLTMSRVVVTNVNKNNDIKTEFLRLVAKLVPIILIYQLYILDYVFIAGVFSTFAAINIGVSFAKMMVSK
jgi:hypothetical protein